MKKQLNYNFPINSGEALSVGVEPLKKGVFISAQSLILDLRDRFPDLWPKNSVAEKRAKETIENWFKALPKELKSMLQAGEIEIKVLTRTDNIEKPSQLELYPDSFEVASNTDSLADSFLNKTIAQKNADSFTKKINNLLELGAEYGKQIDGLPGQTDSDVEVGDLQIARHMIDVAVAGKNSSDGLKRPMDDIGRPLWEQSNFSTLRQLLSGSEEEAMSGVAKKRFRKDEWPEDVIAGRLHLKVDLFSNMDLAFEKPVPSAIERNLAADLKPIEANDLQKYKIPTGGVRFLSVDIVTRALGTEYNKQKIDNAIRNYYLADLISLKRLADRLLKIEDPLKLTNYLRVLKGQTFEESSLLSQIFKNEKSVNDLNLEFNIIEGGRLEMKGSELAQIYPEGAKAFQALREFFAQQKLVLARAELEKQATPKT